MMQGEDFLLALQKPVVALPGQAPAGQACEPAVAGGCRLWVCVGPGEAGLWSLWPSPHAG